MHQKVKHQHSVMASLQLSTATCNNNRSKARLQTTAAANSTTANRLAANVLDDTAA
jgi:hypothetical protein